MSTELIFEFITQFSFYSGSIIFIAGAIGNILNILTFTQFKLFRQNRNAFYLVIESISSLLYVLTYFILTILTFIYGDDIAAHSLVWCRLRYVLFQALSLITYYVICFVAVDQFFSTNHRYNLGQLCTLKLARYFTTVFICLFFVHSIISGSFFDVQPLEGCVIGNSIWLRYSTYFFYPVLNGFLPIIIAALFGMLSYRNVRRIVRRQLSIVRRRLDRQMTALVLARVITFVCLASPYAIYRIYIINFPIPRTKPLEYAIGRLVQAIFSSFIALNYAVSFYVFCILSSRFRRQVKLVLVKKYWQRWKTWCCFRPNQIVPENSEMYGANLELEENI